MRKVTANPDSCDGCNDAIPKTVPKTSGIAVPNHKVKPTKNPKQVKAVEQRKSAAMEPAFAANAEAAAAPELAPAQASGTNGGQRQRKTIYSTLSEAQALEL